MKKYLRFALPIVWAMLIWRLTTTPDFKVTDNTLLSLIISNSGHFIFFGIQAILIFLALPSQLLAILLSSGYGFIIELFQRSVPGRSADPLDWVLDTLGALAFLFVLKKLQSRV